MPAALLSCTGQFSKHPENLTCWLQPPNGTKRAIKKEQADSRKHQFYGDLEPVTLVEKTLRLITLLLIHD